MKPGTPTPWVRIGEEVYTPDNQIMVCEARDGSEDYREQNAAYIAHAANLYPELVEALEGLFRECTMVHNRWGEGYNQREADAAVTAARAVLAKAKGE
jgi:hypothetical protein